MTSQLSEDVLLQIDHKMTPHILTMEAARLGHTAAVLELMSRGAPFAADWLGTSPLHLAAGGAHADTCAVLLRAGVSRDARTKVERTPLHVAAHGGHAAVAALLLRHGAAPDPRDMLRMTPLHWASERGHADTAAVLLAHGADPRPVSKFGKTPRALAAARGHAHIVKLIDDALRDREAVKSVDALREADEQMTYEVEIPAAEQQRALESIERPQETEKPTTKQKAAHNEPIEIDVEKPPEVSQEGGSASGAAALLRKHGITLLPHDSSSTVLNAIQSGRTVVLSDAGKLLLKESVPPAAPPAAAPPAPAAAPRVILTAAPARGPPRPGVKIFTLNNKLLALSKENKLPVKKIINPHDMQVKLVSPLQRPALKPRPRAAPSLRSPVKIIMQKGNYDKLIKGTTVENGVEIGAATPATELAKVLQGSGGAASPPSGTASTPGGTASTPGVTAFAPGGAASSPGALCVPAEFLSSTSAPYLRAQLLAAHRTIHNLNIEIADLRRRLSGT